MKVAGQQGRVRGLRFHDDSGLIGKIILIWLLTLAVAFVAVIDAGSIILARYRAEGAAEIAASNAAAELAAGRGLSAARSAAEAAVTQKDPSATIVAFEVLEEDRVRLVLVDDPSTIVAERLAEFVSSLQSLVEVRVKVVADPPTG